jgi:hypothetical protein
MPTIKLKVITESAANGRTIFTIKEGNTAIAKGSGQFSFTCGNCQTILLENMNQGQFQNIVFKCNACESFNELP